MSLLLKIGIPCAGCVTAGGGLVGSNYIFKKTTQINLDQNASDTEWDKKVENLFQKIKSEETLAAKIDKKSTSAENLAFKDTTKTEFKDKSKARTALKDWCKLSDKGEEQKHEQEFCQIPKKIGWLF